MSALPIENAPFGMPVFRSPEPAQEPTRGDKIRSVIQNLAIALDSDSNVSDVLRFQQNKSASRQEAEDQKRREAQAQYDREFRIWDAMERMKDRQAGRDIQRQNSASQADYKNWLMQQPRATERPRSVSVGEIDKAPQRVLGQAGLPQDVIDQAPQSVFNTLQGAFEKSRSAPGTMRSDAVAEAARLIPQGYEYDDGVRDWWFDQDPGMRAADGNSIPLDDFWQMIAPQQPQMATAQAPQVMQDEAGNFWVPENGGYRPATPEEVAMTGGR